MAAGSTTGFQYRLPGHLLDIKGILVTGQKIELSGGTILDKNIIFASVGAANNRIAPNGRIIPVVRKFMQGDELMFTLRNGHTASQQVTVNIITQD